ncbi:peripheral-type benzodiazepine receptor [Anaeramoeba ignava]|uniref:Peripheral-type benzodiazepine receptor n=1 Tax=Anaeramoeba ignava TaxID=1746090 RepID=A0A9Q0RGC5_ANAIG|nr:peripheral-type benzodiazepine receptor [Anaeramoeba ignava]
MNFILIFTPVIGGFTVSRFSNSGNTKWYQKLHKPKFTPPSYVFPVAWTILYLLIGIVLNREFQKENYKIFLLSIFQLVLNFIWPFFFFKKQKPFVGLIIISLLISVVALIFVSLLFVDFVGALIFAPYLAWLSFAFLLNYKVVELN